MNRSLTIGALALLTTAVAPDVVAQKEDDTRFNKTQADRLHSFAKTALKRGFPRQAKLFWLQAIKLYDPDHAEAHKALGHQHLGRTWSPDPAFRYPTKVTGSDTDGRALFKKYESLKKTLASAHRTRARFWAKVAPNHPKAQDHYKMVLRWAKGDSEAQKALNHEPVGDLTGSTLEKTLYDRSKSIENAVLAQTKIKYESQVVDSSQPLLDKAEKQYITVTSEHFTLRGDAEESIMKEAVTWAERTLRVMQVAFPQDGTFNSNVGRWRTDWAYFVDKESYQQILKANPTLVPNLDWKLEHTSTSGLGPIVVGVTGNRQTLFDACVRNVAQSYAGFGSDGLREGIGHTFVGMMFKNNRLFAVDLEKQQGTVASEEDREYQSPDFDVWKTLNLELAWKSTGGVKASELPLCDAAKFTNEQRIKAWSFCDYMMRRDPKLLQAMDRLRDLKSPFDIEKRFEEQKNVTIAALDKEWEDFWTGASPVMKAILNDTPPLAAVGNNVRKWIDALNAARAQQSASPVSWSLSYSPRCHDHAKYLKNNKLRGLEVEHAQDPLLPGGSHLGDMFAQTAVVSTSAKIGGAKKMFKQWLDIPGYRDVLVHDFLLMVGLYSEGSILVINAVSGLGKPRSKRAGYTSYPRNHMLGIPNQVKVKDIGPELVALLEANGHGKVKTVGYPLTLHFGQNVQGNRSTYKCRVTVRGEDQPGLPLLMDNGKNRRSTAPGMVTFYPLKPLKKGQVDVVWTWTQSNGPQQLAASFQTK